MLTPRFLMRQSIVFEPYKGQGISGAEYGERQMYPCRVNLKPKHSHAQSGMPINENIVSGTVFLPAGTDIPMLSKAIFAGHTYKVLSCMPCFDMSGKVNHVEVELQ